MFAVGAVLTLFMKMVKFISLVAATTKETIMRTIMAIIADTHCGSSTGLQPPSWMTQDGQIINHSVLQSWIYTQFIEGAEAVRTERKSGDRLIVIHDGDPIDGVHHETPQLITTRPDEQQRIHISCMKSWLEIAGYNPEIDSIFYLAGTPAHERPGAVASEVIARVLSAVPSTPPSDQNEQDGQFVWYKWRRRVNGVLIDIAHKGPTPGKRAWLKGNNLRLHIQSMYWDCLNNKLDIPEIYIRAHQHRWIYPVSYQDNQGKITAFLTPSYQGKSEYVYQLDLSDMINIGMLWFIIEDNGRWDWLYNHIDIELDKVEDL